VALVIVLLFLEPERLEAVVGACVREARNGLAGIDLLYQPYDTEADWQPAYAVAARAADAGLGVTAHAGEFSTANLAAALRVPGLTRLGHAVYAAHDPRLLELIAGRGVTVECCLTSNVVLGAVASYQEHPLRRFLAHGIPAVLGSDNPVQLCTTIGREYMTAAALGLTPSELLNLTRDGIRASFAPAPLRSALLAALPSEPTPAARWARFLRWPAAGSGRTR
jgi:adenosine deaminase